MSVERAPKRKQAEELCSRLEPKSPDRWPDRASLEQRDSLESRLVRDKLPQEGGRTGIVAATKHDVLALWTLDEKLHAF
jgi:hypothetical protein